MKNKKKKKKVIFISSVGGHLTQLLELKKINKVYSALGGIDDKESFVEFIFS